MVLKEAIRMFEIAVEAHLYVLDVEIKEDKVTHGIEYPIYEEDIMQ